MFSCQDHTSRIQLAEIDTCYLDGPATHLQGELMIGVQSKACGLKPSNRDLQTARGPACPFCYGARSMPLTLLRRPTDMAASTFGCYLQRWLRTVTTDISIAFVRVVQRLDDAIQ